MTDYHLESRLMAAQAYLSRANGGGEMCEIGKSIDAALIGLRGRNGQDDGLPRASFPYMNPALMQMVLLNADPDELPFLCSASKEVEALCNSGYFMKEFAERHAAKWDYQIRIWILKRKYDPLRKWLPFLLERRMWQGWNNGRFALIAANLQAMQEDGDDYLHPIMFAIQYGNAYVVELYLQQPAFLERAMFYDKQAMTASESEETEDDPNAGVWPLFLINQSTVQTNPRVCQLLFESRLYDHAIRYIESTAQDEEPVDFDVWCADHIADVIAEDLGNTLAYLLTRESHRRVCMVMNNELEPVIVTCTRIQSISAARAFLDHRPAFLEFDFHADFILANGAGVRECNIMTLHLKSPVTIPPSTATATAWAMSGIRSEEIGFVSAILDTGVVDIATPLLIRYLMQAKNLLMIAVVLTHPSNVGITYALALAKSHVPVHPIATILAKIEENNLITAVELVTWFLKTHRDYIVNPDDLYACVTGDMNEMVHVLLNTQPPGYAPAVDGPLIRLAILRLNYELVERYIDVTRSPGVLIQLSTPDAEDILQFAVEVGDARMQNIVRDFYNRRATRAFRQEMEEEIMIDRLNDIQIAAEDGTRDAEERADLNTRRAKRGKTLSINGQALVDYMNANVNVGGGQELIGIRGRDGYDDKEPVLRYPSKLPPLPQEAVFSLMLQVEPGELQYVCGLNQRTAALCRSGVFMRAYAKKHAKLWETQIRKWIYNQDFTALDKWLPVALSMDDDGVTRIWKQWNDGYLAAVSDHMTSTWGWLRSFHPVSCATKYAYTRLVELYMTIPEFIEFVASVPIPEWVEISLDPERIVFVSNDGRSHIGPITAKYPYGRPVPGALLEIAMQSGNVDIIRLAYEHPLPFSRVLQYFGSEGVDIAQLHEWGMLHLSVCIGRDYSNALRYFLENTPEVQNSYLRVLREGGVSALYSRCIEYNAISCARLLIEDRGGAPVDLTPFPYSPQATAAEFIKAAHPAPENFSYKWFNTGVARSSISVTKAWLDMAVVIGPQLKIGPEAVEVGINFESLLKADEVLLAFFLTHPAAELVAQMPLPDLVKRIREGRGGPQFYGMFDNILENPRDFRRAAVAAIHNTKTNMYYAKLAEYEALSIGSEELLRICYKRKDLLAGTRRDVFIRHLAIANYGRDACLPIVLAQMEVSGEMRDETELRRLAIGSGTPEAQKVVFDWIAQRRSAEFKNAEDHYSMVDSKNAAERHREAERVLWEQESALREEERVSREQKERVVRDRELNEAVEAWEVAQGKRPRPIDCRVIPLPFGK